MMLAVIWMIGCWAVLSGVLEISSAIRLRKVIERVTQEAEWGRKRPAGQGIGLAAHYSFVTYMAAVV